VEKLDPALAIGGGHHSEKAIAGDDKAEGSSPAPSATSCRYQALVRLVAECAGVLLHGRGRNPGLPAGGMPTLAGIERRP